MAAKSQHLVTKTSAKRSARDVGILEYTVTYVQMRIFKKNNFTQWHNVVVSVGHKTAYL